MGQFVDPDRNGSAHSSLPVDGEGGCYGEAVGEVVDAVPDGDHKSEGFVR